MAATLFVASAALSYRPSYRPAAPQVHRGVVATGPARASARMQLLLDNAAEPTLESFAVAGPPAIYPQRAAAPSSKPVFLYLPGIEMTGYSLHRQVAALEEDFEVRWLATSPTDRTNLTGLADVVQAAIEDEHAASGRPTYVCGESFGGVLALFVALRDAKRGPPTGLAGLALINPATSVARSWPAQLPALLEALEDLPAGLSTPAYQAIATPIFAAISGDPLQLGGRAADDKLPWPLRPAVALSRLTAQLPLIGELPAAFPLPTLAYRLSMLLGGAELVDALPLSRLTLPVELIASTDDKVLACGLHLIALDCT